MSDAPGNDVRGGEQAGSRVSIGAQLCAARKKRKFTVEKVAKELHLDIDVIKALENDEREKLPAPIFVQGYLKSYGRLVGLPVEGLLKDYSEQMGEPPPLSVIRTAGKLPAVRLRSIRLIRYVFVLLMAGILLWLAWPFLERYMELRHESAGEQVPGRLELPPASGIIGNGFMNVGMDDRGAAATEQSGPTPRSI
ncbi:MAG: helix-turn-helix domain-containing protein [Zetaproteobacteria bacterium]|nr:helix-turn-helix domain-containing protein [Zetaproteobacteria bacterium]